MNPKVHSFVEITRPYNVARWVLSFFIGYFLIGQKQITTDFFAGLVVVIFVHIFITVQNDIADVAIDRINAPSRPIPSGKLFIKEANVLIYTTLAVLLVISLFHFPTHLFFIAPMLLLSWAYNLPPFRLSHRPFASILSLSFLYSVLPLTYGYFSRHHYLNKEIAILLLGWWLIRFVTSLLKDLRDVPGDTAGNKRTFVIAVGKQRTVQLSIVGGFCAYIIILYAVHSIKPSYWLVIPALLALRNIWLRLKLLRLVDIQQLNRQFLKILGGQNQFDLALLLCLLLLK